MSRRNHCQHHAACSEGIGVWVALTHFPLQVGAGNPLLVLGAQAATHCFLCQRKEWTLGSVHIYPSFNCNTPHYLMIDYCIIACSVTAKLTEPF